VSSFGVVSAADLRMTRRLRSPRAFLVRGGRWLRAPRPKLIARSRSPPAEGDVRGDRGVQNEDGEGNNSGYETCEEKVRGDLTAALIASANPVIEALISRDLGAAEIVMALCDRLKKKEEQVEKLKCKVQKARARKEQVEVQLLGQQDLQGQCGRYWWQIQRLKEIVALRTRRHHTHRRPP